MNPAERRVFSFQGHGMARYVSRPRAYWHNSELEPLIAGTTVYEPEPIDTGLYDANGTPIWKSIDPIGFVPLKERA